MTQPHVEFPEHRSLGTVAMQWHGNRLELLDQRLLPNEEVWLTLDSASGVATCIRDMVVRGAPAHLLKTTIGSGYLGSIGAVSDAVRYALSA